MQVKPEIRKFEDKKELFAHAAMFIVQLAKNCVKKKGRFTFALSGGRTPASLFEILADAEYSRKIPWNETYIFWSDERCVPPHHKNSNFKMAKDYLISKIGIPEGNVHRILAEIKPPGKAARFYEDDIRSFFNVSESDLPPSFDLILLGVGPDGHTASLFPGDRVLDENKSLVVANAAPRGMPSKWRITFTLPLINSADCVMFIAADSEKKKVITEILEDRDRAQLYYPAALVWPQGRMLWFVDESSTATF
jgi:6-phosphogluconolactonase